MSDWSKFDALVDLDALRSEIDRASGDYEEVPNGVYEVAIRKMELKESKKGDPMVSVWFSIVAGEYEGQMLFLNQVVKKPFQLHIMNDLLRSLKSGLEVGFESYSQYGSLIEEIREAVDGCEYALEYGERKGYKTFTITEKF